MKLLEQALTAVRYNGEVFTVRNVETLIKDWGVYSFNRSFGLNHGIKPFGQAMNEHADAGFYNKNFTGFGESLSYEHEYVLENVKGNRVDPKCIIADYLKRYPKAAIPSWIKRTYNRRFINRDIGYYPDCNHRMLKAKAGVLREEGEPPIIKWNFAFSAPYDDDYHKRGQRNWKKFRQTRYK